MSQACPLSSSQAQAALVETLAERVRHLEQSRRPGGREVVSSGLPALDELLPEGGFKRGSLVEWLATVGGGAAALALLVARQAAAAGGAVVVLDRADVFYPPAAARLGLDLSRLIVVRPANDADQAWALDQVLRCPGVAALWCMIDERSPAADAPRRRARGQDDHTWRRWQLAAETSGVVGLILRDAAARAEPSWADLRLLVEPIAEPEHAWRARRLRIEVLRAAGARLGAATELELPLSAARDATDPLAQQTSQDGRRESRSGLGDAPHETRAMHLASSLATATNRRGSRRA